MNNISNIFEKMKEIKQEINFTQTNNICETENFHKNKLLLSCLVGMVWSLIDDSLLEYYEAQKIIDSKHPCDVITRSEQMFLKHLQNSFDVFYNNIEDLNEPSRLLELYFNTLYVAVEESLDLHIKDLKSRGFHSVNFDYLHNEVGAYSKEQIIGLINYKGGIIEYYERFGSGGGNPEFTALLPKEVTEEEFLKAVYREEYEQIC